MRSRAGCLKLVVVANEDDSTLGGYLSVHSRPPAFEACDGYPYTVSIETERSADLRAPAAAYLVFPRWAESGVGIVGHVETPLLWRAATPAAAEARAAAIPLHEVQRLLDEAVVRKAASEVPDAARDNAPNEERDAAPGEAQ